MQHILRNIYITKKLTQKFVEMEKSSNPRDLLFDPELGVTDERVVRYTVSPMFKFIRDYIMQRIV